jgi:uncharacterized membrane protein
MMTSPFDLYGALLAKHAQHVALIHFPIALFIVGVVFDFVGAWKKNVAWAHAAFCNMTAAVVMLPPTLVSGLLAWQFQLEGHRMKGILLYHVLAASGSAVFILWNWWIQFRTWRGGGILPVWRFPVELVGVMMVMLTGHLGGFLSGVNL